ncbi:MAG: TfuA-like protein [Kofleriaceae bacterium]
MTDVLMYAGPTLHRARKIAPHLSLDGIRVLPPIERGILPRLRGATPGTLILVDGMFHQTLSVGHAEIRTMLLAGWRVWGLSSMGAIRAREMMHMGMRGYGTVFERYCREDLDVRDDEVTLLHQGEPPYVEMSEPLCHLQLAIEDAVTRGVVSRADGDAVLGELSAMWYGDRTLALFEAQLRARAGERAGEVAAIVRDFDRWRSKAHDLIAFLEERPWAK